MTDDQLLRYARHVMLGDIGIEGQRRLLAAHALVIGAGGLGSPVALYLGSAGVGRITLVDDDSVDLSNLQRQIAHRLSRVGWPKAQSAAASVQQINADVAVNAVMRRADAEWLNENVPQADVVLDCSDNFATRQAVNAACVQHRKPLVWGAAVGWAAQMSVVDPLCATSATSPCYACLFPPEALHQDVACATLGVLAPLVGIVGSLQAAEALKLLLGVGSSLAGSLLMLDAKTMAWDRLAVARNPHCSVCGTQHAFD